VGNPIRKREGKSPAEVKGGSQLNLRGNYKREPSILFRGSGAKAPEDRGGLRSPRHLALGHKPRAVV